MLITSKNKKEEKSKWDIFVDKDIPNCKVAFKAVKSLVDQIQNILTPNNSVGLIKEDRIFKLQPIMPLSSYLKMVKDIENDSRKKFLKFLSQKGTVIFNGVIYLSTRGLNFKGRMKEILTIYNSYLRELVGDKKALLDLYEKIPAEDIANLTEDHVIFVLKKLNNSNKKALAAIRYLPEYEIYFESKVYKMPGCTIAIHIDSNLRIDNPEVIAESNSNFYEHPFVYRNRYKLGQKICLGSFYKSKDQKQFSNLRFANNINYLIKQSVQILISGYNRRVNPANSHLTNPKYEKYIKTN